EWPPRVDDDERGRQGSNTMRSESRAKRGRSRRFDLLCGLVFTTILVVNAGGLALSEAMKRLGPVPLGENLSFSPVVLDRDGRRVRALTTADGYWRLPAARQDVDRRFVDMLIAYEDKRFY